MPRADRAETLVMLSGYTRVISLPEILEASNEVYDDYSYFLDISVRQIFRANLAYQLN